MTNKQISSENELDEPTIEPSEAQAVIESSTQQLTPYQLKRQKIKAKHPQTSERWTTANDQKLTELFNKGYSVPSLMRELERTRNAIRARLERLGLVEDRWQAAANKRANDQAQASETSSEFESSSPLTLPAGPLRTPSKKAHQ